jgi:hypothetical protein
MQDHHGITQWSLTSRRKRHSVRLTPQDRTPNGTQTSSRLRFQEYHEHSECKSREAPTDSILTWPFKGTTRPPRSNGARQYFRPQHEFAMLHATA